MIDIATSAGNHSIAVPIEAVALEPCSLWHIAMPGSDEELAGRFAKGFVAYLSCR